MKFLDLMASLGILSVLLGLIKVPLKRVFDDFLNGNLDIGRLNFGTIMLLPKCEDAMVIQKFRPMIRLKHIYNF
jgi:hypothetical protein